MKAKVQLLRILPDKTERLIEAPIGPSIAEVQEGETVKCRLWHGSCLDSELIVSVSNGRTIVRLLEKKELRADAPKEALECSS